MTLFFVEIKEGQVRCGEHSDYGTLTLLFQDLIGGLEVKYFFVINYRHIKKMKGEGLN